MKICTLLIASALSVSAALASQTRFRSGHRRLLVASASSDDFPASLKSVPNDDAFHMEPVRAVHARVEAEAPMWDAEHGLFVSAVGESFEERFRAGLDTANTVSVEGALMYVQTEGINYAARAEADKCARQNGMKYVVLYGTVFAQTNETLALYGADSEYGPYLTLNDGQCAPNGDATFPKECLALDGTDGEPRLGPFVGAKQRAEDARAPYANVWQYSFPNTCPLEKWGEKTDACRAESSVPGLCAADTKPDGAACTFNYRVLGWVPLDDLVGITQLKDASDAPYADFAAFCAANGVEFNVDADGTWVDGLDFWKEPANADANAARVAKLLSLYADAIKGNATLAQVSAEDVARFRALPTSADLRDANPPCYKSTKSCATAEFGCRRDLLSQMCTKCEADESGCVVAPDGYTYPTLTATSAPETPEPTTKEPETPAPTTKEPETPEPTTKEPETPEPTTKEPETPEPTTKEPETPAPTTKEPETPEPSTEEPETPAPTTKEPETPEPTTKEPETPEPTTKEPETPEPTTEDPGTFAPADVPEPEPTTKAPEPTTPPVVATPAEVPEPTTKAPEPTTPPVVATPAEVPEPTTKAPEPTTPPVVATPADVPTETTAPPPAGSATPAPASPTSAPTSTATSTPASNTTSSKSEKESTASQRVVVTAVAIALSFVASCLVA